MKRLWSRVKAKLTERKSPPSTENPSHLIVIAYGREFIVSACGFPHVRSLRRAIADLSFPDAHLASPDAVLFLNNRALPDDFPLHRVPPGSVLHLHVRAGYRMDFSPSPASAVDGAAVSTSVPTAGSPSPSPPIRITNRVGAAGPVAINAMPCVSFSLLPTPSLVPREAFQVQMPSSKLMPVRVPTRAECAPEKFVTVAVDTAGVGTRSLRVPREYPVGMLRDLFDVDVSQQILLDGVVVTNEDKTFAELQVTPARHFHFAPFALSPPQPPKLLQVIETDPCKGGNNNKNNNNKNKKNNNSNIDDCVVVAESLDSSPSLLCGIHARLHADTDKEAEKYFSVRRPECHNPLSPPFSLTLPPPPPLPPPSTLNCADVLPGAATPPRPAAPRIIEEKEKEKEGREAKKKRTYGQAHGPIFPAAVALRGYVIDENSASDVGGEPVLARPKRSLCSDDLFLPAAARPSLFAERAGGHESEDVGTHSNGEHTPPRQTRDISSVFPQSTGSRVATTDAVLYESLTQTQDILTSSNKAI